MSNTQSVSLWILTGLPCLHGYSSVILTEFSLFFAHALRHEDCVLNIYYIYRDSYMQWLPKLNLVFWKLQKKTCKPVGKPKPEDKQGLKALTKEYIVTNCIFQWRSWKSANFFLAPDCSEISTQMGSRCKGKSSHKIQVFLLF